jgi:hypothetical protein
VARPAARQVNEIGPVCADVSAGHRHDVLGHHVGQMIDHRHHRAGAAYVVDHGWRAVIAGELLSGPLTDDGLARTRYGSSARQLRRLRKAVLSGAMRQQAERLGVTLPHGFVDVPKIQAIEASPGSPGD